MILIGVWTTWPSTVNVVKFTFQLSFHRPIVCIYQGLPAITPNPLWIPFLYCHPHPAGSGLAVAPFFLHQHGYFDIRFLLNNPVWLVPLVFLGTEEINMVMHTSVSCSIINILLLSCFPSFPSIIIEQSTHEASKQLLSLSELCSIRLCFERQQSEFL